jgi:hypothetical protein
MKLHKRLFSSALLLAAIVAGGSTLHAQDHDRGLDPDHREPCRTGLTLTDPAVGAYTATLNVAGLGSTQGLIQLNQGGTVIETDGLDLQLPNSFHTAGYGSWKAVDCEHYKVTFNKIIYFTQTRQFETTILEGDITLAEDGNSWTANINQQYLNADSTVLSTDVVTVEAKRIQAGSTE